MNVRAQARGLIAVAILALAIVSVPHGTAYAMPKRTGDSGTRCSYYNPANGEIQYFLPGEVIAVADSQANPVQVRCGSDGRWYRA